MSTSEFRQVMAEQKNDPLVEYKASCHCGRVQLSFKHGPLETETIVSCNCSMCTRNGYLLTYPQAENVTIACDDAEMGSYRFATHEKPHRFCKTCGCSILIDFRECNHEVLRRMMAINIRMIHGIEDRLPSLTLKVVNGKERLNPQYNPVY